MQGTGHRIYELTVEPLQAMDFGRRYRRRAPWAVRNLSITVPQGSITALVGPNGAGKSTLIRACVGFERPDEGHILVGGYDPRRERAAAVEFVGYVPQAATLYRHLTVGDHFAIASAARPRFDRAHAAERLRLLGLAERQRVGELSGGQQAQVALAMALATNAPLLLLDEPLASLDPLARRDFLGVLIDDVRGRGRTALLSSHVVTDVEMACDRLAVIVAGRLVLDTDIEEARKGHLTVPAGTVPKDVESVGTFRGPEGQMLTLARGGAHSHQASLEEIVLGYLSGAT